MHHRNFDQLSHATLAHNRLVLDKHSDSLSLVSESTFQFRRRRGGVHRFSSQSNRVLENCEPHIG